MIMVDVTRMSFPYKKTFKKNEDEVQLLRNSFDEVSMVHSCKSLSLKFSNWSNKYDPLNQTYFYAQAK